MGSVFFLVDSEPPESEDYSPPGQTYPEASAILLNTFVSGKETTEGPLTDRWGTWVSGCRSDQGYRDVAGSLRSLA